MCLLLMFLFAARGKFLCSGYSMLDTEVSFADGSDFTRLCSKEYVNCIRDILNVVCVVIATNSVRLP